MSKTIEPKKVAKKSSTPVIDTHRYDKILPEGFKLTANSDRIYNPKQQGSAFYTTGDSWTVATVSYEDEEFGILVAGEMRIELNDATIRTVWDLEDAGITTDKKLEKMDEASWENNSWFEVFDVNTSENYSDDIADSVEEGIMACVEAILAKVEKESE